MKALFITGSGRKDSVTTKLSGIAAETMAAAVNGTEITFISPGEMHIEHCKNCGQCSSTGRCIVHDDMQTIYDAVEKNDIIVISTPVYFSGPSSIMKQVIDRFHCVWLKGRTKKSKKTAALIVAGGQKEPVFTNTISISKAFAATIGAEWAGELKVSNTDETDKISDELISIARGFAADVIKVHSGRV